MNFQPKVASRKNAKLKMALVGVSGAGKSFSALAVARGLVGPGGRILALDTEHGSLSKYAGDFHFEVIELESFDPRIYTEAIQFAERERYDALIIDSLSHAWTGKGGALEQVDNAARRSQSKNTFGAWRDVTPLHNALIDAIVGARLHVIATMRAKTEFVQEKNEKTGRTEVRKVGMAPVQRDGMEYEFDVVGDLDADHNLIITKTRCRALDGAIVNRPGEGLAATLRAWLDGDAAGDSPAADSPESPGQPAPCELPVYCHCGIEARYVRGKTASGWVCGYAGSDNPVCDFKRRDGEAAVGEAAPNSALHLVKNGAEPEPPADYRREGLAMPKPWSKAQGAAAVSAAVAHDSHHEAARAA